MTDLEYIDNYFKGELSAGEIIAFDKRIIDDPVFAEEVFLYCGSMGLVKEKQDAERKQRFREFYKAESVKVERAKPAMLAKLRPYLVAAAVITGIVLVSQVLLRASSLQEKADQYISRNLNGMSVQMSSTENDLQTAKRLYNENQLAECLQLLERIMPADTISGEVRKMAGIVSLRLGEYDKAIEYFSALEKIKLYANPGKFYHALTLIKRNRPGDWEFAKSLLQQVVKENLEEKETAANWLKDF